MSKNSTELVNKSPETNLEDLKNSVEGHYFLGYKDNFEYDKSDVVIFPVGFEGTVSYGKGTINGPKAIIESSHYLESFDEEFKRDPSKKGIHTLKISELKDSKPKEAVEFVKTISKRLINDNKFPVMIGGEHSLTQGLIDSLAEVHESFTIIQIDAHTDLENNFDGEKYSHASVMRNVYEKHGKKINIVQLGIRSISEELFNFLKTTTYIKQPIRTIYAHEIAGRNAYTLAEKINMNLKQKIFITIDVDGFDPSIFPNTGTPEPNGILWQQFFDLMKIILRNKQLIGFDFMEFASDGKEHYSDFSASKMIYKMLCLK